MQNFIIQALGLETYTEEFMQSLIKFLLPYKEKLLNFEYMILNVDNFNDCYGSNSDIEIIRNDDIVVYKNIRNVKWSKKLSIDWKDELKEIIKNGCSDSDIENFVDKHSEVDAKEIWNYVYEYNAPDGCKGCRFIQMSGMMPCMSCTRRVEVKDYYKSR